jgi:glycosyltransferase involved in cell wall biosynthesis
LHISYIHSPVRYAWNQYFAYFSPAKLGFFSRLIIPPMIHRLRQWDVISTSRVDHFLANSNTVARRIFRYYRRRADIAHPPVDSELFKPGNRDGDYYLIVSALVPYKRLDLAIQAFNRNGLKLKIAGNGPDYKKLKKAANKNIEFLGFLSSQALLQAYQGAKALLMPGEEDFGINSLEAQACGVPVIAFGQGGVTETVIPEKTGLFFKELSAESLQAALDKFKDIAFNPSIIRDNALKFSRDQFKQKAATYFRDKWEEFQSKK